jgi:hypothetical protein
MYPFQVDAQTANKFIFFTTRFSSIDKNDVSNAQLMVQSLTIDEASITSIERTINEIIALTLKRIQPHDSLSYKQEHDCIEDIARRVLEDEAGCETEGIYTCQGLRHIDTENAQRDEEQDDESEE